MQAQIVKEKISKEELVKITKENYGKMVKVDIDIKKEILAIGGEWHSEGDKLLNAQEGSHRENVWGVNFYPWRKAEKRIEYNSLINIKPSIGHTKMEIQNGEVRNKIRAVIEKFLLSNDETL